MKKFEDNGLDCIYFEYGSFDEHPNNEFFSISKYIEPADHNYDRYKEMYEYYYKYQFRNFLHFIVLFF